MSATPLVVGVAANEVGRVLNSSADFVSTPLHNIMVPSFDITSGPASEPITVDEVKLQIRVDNAVEDDLLTTYITAARLAFERLTHGRVLIATTFKEYIPSWDHCYNQQPYQSIYPYPYGYGTGYGGRWNATGWRPLRLSRGKVSAIASITYYDSTDTLQNLTGHNIDLTGIPALIRMATAPWPVLSCQRARPITVTYTAGYADAAAVPSDIKVALLSLVAHMYYTREAYSEGTWTDVPMAFCDFCSQYDTGLGGY